jgi:hypothetical protein
VDHITHSRVANPTPLQIQSLDSSSNYNQGERLKLHYRFQHTRNDVEKWLHFLKEHGISRPHVEVETVVLMDSKDEDEKNFHLLQHLK